MRREFGKYFNNDGNRKLNYIKGKKNIQIIDDIIDYINAKG